MLTQVCRLHLARKKLNLYTSHSATEQGLISLKLRRVRWVHSVVISRGEVIVNETSTTSARYI